MPRRLRHALLLLGLALCPAAWPAAAQDALPPWEGGLTASLGQPPRYRLHTIAGTGLDWRKPGDLNPIILGGVGVSRSLLNPITGLLAASVEGYAGLRGTRPDGGIRALMVNTTLRLTGGVDYNLAAGRLSPLMGYSMPVRRGGVFGGGSLVRLELNLGTADAVRASVIVPLRQPAAGQTRPRREVVEIAERHPERLSRPGNGPGLDSALATVHRAAMRIQNLVVPAIDDPAEDPREALAPLVARLRQPSRLPGVLPNSGLAVEATVRAYHAELVRAFSIAVSGSALPPGGSTDQGVAAAQLARRALLEHVIYPYNRLLGRRKERNTLVALSGYARGAFVRSLVTEGLVSPAQQAAAEYVFQELLYSIAAIEVEALQTWQDRRLVWLPLQLALRPEEHDSQEELDRIIEAGVDTRFADGNQVWYVVNEQFRVEVIRTIRDARDYHVLWIHDFRGRNAEGAPDRAAFQYVVGAYLTALTERVRDYDRSGRLPVYMIFLDQHYYEQNRGHLWLDFLERPLGPLPQLPRGSEALSRELRDARDSLTAAIERSQLLQSERRQYGERWFRNLVKVHVSITNPADASFWGKDIIPVLGMPDDIMRDHRKIAFYDVTESDPYRGLAIYTGMGVGEHYVGPTWEDRAIMVQGPAIRTLKAQARRLLLTQGLREDEIPAPLRPEPMPASYDAMVQARVDSLRQADRLDNRAMELHNGTGFLDKPINVARATLYSLMPSGAVIKVPDSLWGSAIYAALLAGSAFRGVRVLFMAPSLVSAPSSGWPAMGIAHDLFARLIVLQQDLGPEIEAAGGLLKTGIYNPGIGVQSIDRRLAAAYRNARLTPFLRRLFPISPTVDTLLVELGRNLAAAQEAGALPAEAPVSPKLHLKAAFFASREAWDNLVSRPEMLDVVLAYRQQFVGCGEGEWPGARESAVALGGAGQRLWTGFRNWLTPDNRGKVMYYLLVGSANQDYRSMFMDGEASVLISGWSSVMSLVDFGLLVNLSVWVDDLELLDALLPPPTGFQRKMARWLRPMM